MYSIMYEMLTFYALSIIKWTTVLFLIQTSIGIFSRLNCFPSFNLPKANDTSRVVHIEETML